MKPVLSLCYFLTLMAGLCVALAREGHAEGNKDHKIPASKPLSGQVALAMDQLVGHALNQADWNPADSASFEMIVQSKDRRLSWTLVDIMKFTWRAEFFDLLKQTAAELNGLKLTGLRQRQDIANHLITKDIPAYPDYLKHKRAIYTNYVRGWERMFVSGDIDWRLVDWGGVNVDDRAYGETDEICHCIPAIDNPTIQPASQATWLKPDAIVFGIEVNGEARAYPLRIMEVRELVNDTLGGRNLAIPYCSLCGTAQAYFTDRIPNGLARPIMRTSGLLLRSNKIMFDINTYSLFETFFGRAVTGPLAKQKVVLPTVSVIATNWASWVSSYPHTTVLTEDLALGRDYDLRNTRDGQGAIFPIGDVDARLASHETVLGVVGPDGQAYAFHAGAAIAALRGGQVPQMGDVLVELSAGGLQAFSLRGTRLSGHPSYWFAWSQFHPQTQLWPRSARN